jgi:hypothetical protein
MHKVARQVFHPIVCLAVRASAETNGSRIVRIRHRRADEQGDPRRDVEAAEGFIWVEDRGERSETRSVGRKT